MFLTLLERTVDADVIDLMVRSAEWAISHGHGHHWSFQMRHEDTLFIFTLDHHWLAEELWFLELETQDSPPELTAGWEFVYRQV